MTASITTIQNEIKTLLDTVAAGTPPVPFAVRIAEDDVKDMPKLNDPADVIIGFEASARLARTSQTVLDQVLLPVAIKRRHAKQDQSILDANHALAELLRDTLADYHSSTARVEQLLSPNPFDQVAAVGPGEYVHRFLLDLDVLRGAAITTDVTTPSQTLTKVRRAVWDAIDNWPEWDNLSWARKFESDQDLDELALHDPGYFDLPAIAVEWGPTNPKFFTHIVEEWPATVLVHAWFPCGAMRLAEYRAWQIVRAVYQCTPPDTPTMTYIRTATGRLPEKISPITIEPVSLGRTQSLKALKATCTFTISKLMSPWSE